ncbi:DMT family transporter [Clostridium aminobutyricum]|uniref:DMT family transporter n=1 Tax=Clostridium aminobutyricum TaxID=33953 RepID=A0A939D7W1_CLOAM|nr:DMT family transporter [Clostridium aminobutyricum]MBN7772433.1 DMT family transporter [Clostridium aminobutyricum]
MTGKTKAYIYLILATVGWGTLYVAGKYVLEVVPSFTLLFFRYLIGISTLLLFYRNRPKTKIAKEDYKKIGAIGVVGYFLGIAFQFIGTNYCSASMASIINSVNPVFIILCAALMINEKPTKNQIISVIIALIGTVVIIGNIGEGNETIGILFSFGSVVTWSIASVYIREICQKYDTILITIYAMGIGFICDIPFAFYSYISAGLTLSSFSLPIILCILYIGTVCTAGALTFWNKGLELLDSSTCSLFYPLQPLTSAVLGVICLNEALNLNFIVGSILIIGGIVYAVLADRNKLEKL